MLTATVRLIAFFCWRSRARWRRRARRSRLVTRHLQADGTTGRKTASDGEGKKPARSDTPHDLIRIGVDGVAVGAGGLFGGGHAQHLQTDHSTCSPKIPDSRSDARACSMDRPRQYGAALSAGQHRAEHGIDPALYRLGFHCLRGASVHDCLNFAVNHLIKGQLG